VLDPVTAIGLAVARDDLAGVMGFKVWVRQSNRRQKARNFVNSRTFCINWHQLMIGIGGQSRTTGFLTHAIPLHYLSRCCNHNQCSVIFYLNSIARSAASANISTFASRIQDENRTPSARTGQRSSQLHDHHHHDTIIQNT